MIFDNVSVVLLLLAGVVLSAFALTGAVMDIPKVAYNMAPVDSIGTVPNKKQEQACLNTLGQGSGVQNVRMVSGIVVSDWLYGGIGIETPTLDLDRDKVNVLVAVPNHDQKLLVHGIPSSPVNEGDTLNLCGAFGGPTFLWPLISYQHPTWSLFGGASGGPIYGSPAPVQYENVLWVSGSTTP